MLEFCSHGDDEAWNAPRKRDSMPTLPFRIRSVLGVLGAFASACSAAPSSGFTPEGSSNPGMGPGGGDDSGIQLGGGDDGGTVALGDATVDGPIDTTPPCDMGLAVDDNDPANFAKAIGICTTAATAGYGLVGATYSNAFGSTTPPHAGQWGLLPEFGSVIVPLEGSRLGVLSSGYAREYDDLTGALLAYSGTS
jgi:hypothetical protein